MTLRWTTTESPEETDAFSAALWQRHKDAISSGEFWADRLANVRADPERRLQLAIDNLPLPAAFREAAVAVRSLVRAKRKLRVDFKDELALLYWLAAVNSFSVPFSEVLNEPGYNVIQAIPGKEVKTLPFTYNELGYEHLALLNKTDVKWIEEAWGAPVSHGTLHRMHIGLWREFEERLRLAREAERAKFVGELRALLSQSRQ